MKTGKTICTYGTDIPKIIELQNNEPELKETTSDYDYTMAEVAWAIVMKWQEQSMMF
jgi:glycerol-3-phosphate dehydrogenase